MANLGLASRDPAFFHCALEPELHPRVYCPSKNLPERLKPYSIIVSLLRKSAPLSVRQLAILLF